MEKTELFQSNNTGYLYAVLHIESGYYCMIANGEKESIRLPSPLDPSVHDMAHFRDLPLLFERIREAHAGVEFVPFSVRRKDDSQSPMYVERLKRIDDHHVLLQAILIRKAPVKLAPASPQSAWSSPFFEHMEEAGVLLCTNGEVMKINSAFTKEYGWTEEDLVGGILPYVPDDLREEFELTRARLLAGEKKINLDTVRLKKDGTRVPVSIRAYPVFDSDGRLAGTTAMLISKESAAATQSLIQLQERIIKDRDQLIVDIMENTDLGVGQYDYIRNRFIYLSPAIRGLFEVELNEIYVNAFAFQKYVHPDDREKMADVLCNPDSNGEMDFRVIVPGKGLKWLRTKSVPIYDDEGRIVRLIGFTQDITRQKFSEEISLKWEKLGMVGHLAAGIAHEVRNPLTAVKGFMQLLDETGSAGDYAEIIMDQLERIELIVNELLMLAEPHEEDEMRPADLEKVLSEVVPLLKAEARMHNSTIRFKIQGGPLPAVCKTDEIKHVIINLVKNSLEAMPDGGTINISAWTNDGGPVIEVRDEGIGIPEERLTRLGEPFYSNKEKGTGMGLMKSFKIMERHGGTIEFESEIGKGTTARIRFPIDSETTIS
ncbi:ATP-binding protein [Bhargavaea changchunensis]|uniref:histidine kinase n=2 Tax=Bhargavaea changchunensis TaxID=2134037 RepID=A0ABW2NLG0_9BACL|nr:PAS domain-containing sensor histidine kinase [Bhargavaea sp. CC-171006]